MLSISCYCGRGYGLQIGYCISYTIHPLALIPLQIFLRGIGSANEKAKLKLQKKTKQYFNALRSSIFQFSYPNDKFYLEGVKCVLNRPTGSERGIYT
jgi:hypothetical protein